MRRYIKIYSVYPGSKQFFCVPHVGEFKPVGKKHYVPVSGLFRETRYLKQGRIHCRFSAQQRHRAETFFVRSVQVSAYIPERYAGAEFFSVRFLYETEPAGPVTGIAHINFEMAEIFSVFHFSHTFRSSC